MRRGWWGRPARTCVGWATVMKSLAFAGGVRGVRVRSGGLGGAQAGGPYLRAGGCGPYSGDDGPARDPGGGRGDGRSAGARQRAGGGVGTYAVQIAVALGAEVTGVCSTRNAELVRSLGAAHVIDYTREDFTGGRAHYDVILDNVSSLSLTRLRGALTPKGNPRAQRRRFARPRLRAGRWHPAGNRGQRVRLAAAAPAPVPAEPGRAAGCAPVQGARCARRRRRPRAASSANEMRMHDQQGRH